MPGRNIILDPIIVDPLSDSKERLQMIKRQSTARVQYLWHAVQESGKVLTNKCVWPIWRVYPKKLTGYLVETIWLAWFS